MIAPRVALLIFVAVVTIPAAALHALVPTGGLLAPVAFFIVALAALADIALSRKRLSAVRVTFPDTVRLSKDRQGPLSLVFQNDSPWPARVRVGLSFPYTVQPESEILEAVLPPSPDTAELTWLCTASQRGNFELRDVHLETRSALGLWNIRALQTGRTELKVYPNLQRERNAVASIFLSRGGLGGHAQRRVGKGRDFDQLRDYIAGDSSEDIHWKATARRGHPVTKIYQVERTQEVYVVIDTSRLSARAALAGASHETQLERFINAGLALGLVAEKQGDLFGLATFSDRVDTFIRAKTGRAHFGGIREAVYTLQPRMVNPDYQELFTLLRLRLRRRALILLLTNLDDPLLAEEFEQHLQLLSKRHLILVNTMPPLHIRPLFTSGTGASVDGVYEQLAGHLQWQELRKLQLSLHHKGVSMSLVNQASLLPELVAQYMSVKQRQLL